MEGALSGTSGWRPRRPEQTCALREAGHRGARTGTTAFPPEVPCAGFLCGHLLSHPAGVGPVWLSSWSVLRCATARNRYRILKASFKEKKSPYNVSLLGFPIVNTLKYSGHDGLSRIHY